MTNSILFLDKSLLDKIFLYLDHEEIIQFISTNHLSYQQLIRQYQKIYLKTKTSVQLFLTDEQYRKEEIFTKIINPSKQLELNLLQVFSDDSFTLEDIDPRLECEGFYSLFIDTEAFDALMKGPNSSGIQTIEDLFLRYGSVTKAHLGKEAHLGKATVSLTLHVVNIPKSLKDCLSLTLKELVINDCTVVVDDDDEDDDVAANEDKDDDDEDHEQEDAGSIFGPGLADIQTEGKSGNHEEGSEDNSHESLKHELVLPYLPNLEILRINATPISNLYQFGYVRELWLENLEIHDLTPFRNVPILTLRHCASIRDITCLQDNQTVRIEDCPKITNYSESFKNSKNITLQLGSRFKLNLSYYSAVESLEILAPLHPIKMHILWSSTAAKSLKTLVLEGLKANIRLALFSHLESIKLRACSAINSLMGLENVETIWLKDMKALESLIGLGRNESVVIEDCPLLKDFSPIQSIPTVVIKRCEGLKNAADLSEVTDLTLKDCNQIENILLLQNVKKLTIRSCFSIHDGDLERLAETIPHLIVDGKTLRKKEMRLNHHRSSFGSQFGIAVIPDSVYLSILDYLLYKETVEFICTNSYLYEIMMKKKRQLTITYKTIDRFFTNRDYLRNILSCIENPLQQLHVCDEYSGHFAIQQYFQCAGYHTIDLDARFFVDLCAARDDWKARNLVLRCGDASRKQIMPKDLAKAIDSLFLDYDHYYPGFLDYLSPSLIELDLQIADQLTCTLPPLPNLRKLSLSCIVTNITDFQYVQELKLTGFEIVDLHPYKAFRKIVLDECPSLRDITPLQSNETVEVRDCKRLQDFESAFSECRTIKIEINEFGAQINLSNYQNVEEFSLIGVGNKDVEIDTLASREIPLSLKKLLLKNLSSFHDLTGFAHLEKVELDGCCSIVSLDGLSRVREVTLRELWNLESLNGLCGNSSSTLSSHRRKLEIEKCQRVVDFRPLQSFHTVSVIKCKGFSKASDVKGVYAVTIDDCLNIVDLREIGNVHRLKIANCHRIRSKEGLEGVSVLIIEKCKYIK